MNGRPHAILTISLQLEIGAYTRGQDNHLLFRNCRPWKGSVSATDWNTQTHPSHQRAAAGRPEQNAMVQTA